MERQISSTQKQELERKYKALAQKEFPNPFPDRVEGKTIRVAGFVELMKIGCRFSQLPEDVQQAVTEYMDLKAQVFSPED